VVEAVREKRETEGREGGREGIRGRGRRGVSNRYLERRTNREEGRFFRMALVVSM
jgi:hypothetical protein